MHFKARLCALKRISQADDADRKKETQIKKLTWTSALTLKNYKVAQAAFADSNLKLFNKLHFRFVLNVILNF